MDETSVAIVERPTFLEGMRGVAAWMVVFGHMVNAYWPIGTGAFWASAKLSHVAKVLLASPVTLPFKAYFAVLLFFMHSGLVLSFKYLSGGKKSEYLTSAALRRYIRLAGPSVASVLIAYALASSGALMNRPVAAITHSDWLKSAYNFVPSFWGALKQGTYDYFFTSGVPSGESYNSVLWSITVEFLGSFFVFAFLALWGRMSRRWLMYLILGILFRNHLLLSFILGMLLCELYVLQSRGALRRMPASVSVLSLLAGFYFGCADVGLENGPVYRVLGPLLRNGWSDWIQMLGAFLVILAILNSKPIQKALSRPLMLLLGRLSFSVYLLHMSILCTLGCSLYLILSRAGLPSGGRAAISGLAVVVVTFVVSVFYQRWVDSKCIQLARAVQEVVLQPVPAATEYAGLGEMS